MINEHTFTCAIVYVMCSCVFCNKAVVRKRAFSQSNLNLVFFPLRKKNAENGEKKKFLRGAVCWWEKGPYVSL